MPTSTNKQILTFISFVNSMCTISSQLVLKIDTLLTKANVSLKALNHIPCILKFLNWVMPSAWYT